MVGREVASLVFDHTHVFGPQWWLPVGFRLFFPTIKASSESWWQLQLQNTQRWPCMVVRRLDGSGAQPDRGGSCARKAGWVDFNTVRSRLVGQEVTRNWRRPCLAEMDTDGGWKSLCRG